MRISRVLTIRAAIVSMFMSMFIFISMMGSHASHATPVRGPHGGELRKAIGIPANSFFELVIKHSAQGKEIHVYGVNAQGRNVNLKSSGYGGITFKMGDVELPLDCAKVDDQGYITNDSEAIEHYRAVGKFPSSANIELEVTIAFPSKQGTGKATFRPFANQDDSWR